MLLMLALVVTALLLAAAAAAAAAVVAAADYDFGDTGQAQSITPTVEKKKSPSSTPMPFTSARPRWVRETPNTRVSSIIRGALAVVQELKRLDSTIRFGLFLNFDFSFMLAQCSK